MNQNDTKDAGAHKTDGGNPPRRKILAAALGGVLIAAAGAALYWSQAMQYCETTEDAYVDGNVVQVTTQIAGTVTTVAADNTDHVAAGQVLVKLNPLDAQLALERSEAQLAKTVRQVRAQYAMAAQMRANVELRQSELQKAQADLDRRTTLVKSGAISSEELHHAQDAVRTARAALTFAEQQFAANQAYVERTSIETHPDVMSAAAQVKDAYLASVRTDVPAPVGGIVAKRGVQVGQRVNAGTPLMAIVPVDHVWVTANFKESQLRHIRIGQPVELSADLYGTSVTYHGTVIGQDAGTGSAFSLLPAQNATGNWIKVVQRVPVRIALDPAEIARHPLQIGLSMTVAVDTRDRNGERLSPVGKDEHAYHTDVFSRENKESDRLVRHIVRANLAAAQPAAQAATRTAAQTAVKVVTPDAIQTASSY